MGSLLYNRHHLDDDRLATCLLGMNYKIDNETGQDFLKFGFFI